MGGGAGGADLPPLPAVSLRPLGVWVENECNGSWRVVPDLSAYRTSVQGNNTNPAILLLVFAGGAGGGGFFLPDEPAPICGLTGALRYRKETGIFQ